MFKISKVVFLVFWGDLEHLLVLVTQQNIFHIFFCKHIFSYVPKMQNLKRSSKVNISRDGVSGRHFSVALPSAPTLAGIQYFGKGYYLYLLCSCRGIYRDIEPDLKHYQILFISFFVFYVLLCFLRVRVHEIT